MRVVTLGHAGLLIEAAGRGIVCDPWFRPAFLGAWFPFPRNDELDPELIERIRAPDFLYVSHLHSDHLDAGFLADEMSKDVTVLLPAFPTDELRRALGALGFRNFMTLDADEPVEIAAGLSVYIGTETAVTDGPQGDSLLWVSDGAATMLNQNDCRPHDFDRLRGFGPVDVQYLQYSGAIWYPMVYDLEPKDRARLALAKREAQLARAMRYVELVGPRAAVPFAGPPAFLDPDLAQFNDLGDPTSIFPDQRVFLDRLAERNVAGIFNVPGTVVDVGATEFVHGGAAASEYFSDKASMIDRYARDWAGWLSAHKAGWAEPSGDLVGRLARWWDPLLADAPTLRRGVGANVLIRSGVDDVVIDFPAGEVRAWSGEPYAFRFEIDRRVLETVLASGAIDWSNALFLSCRFRAWREGSYNEYVYNFFKSLSPERMSRAEAEAVVALGVPGVRVEFRCGDYMVERFCPHRSADLAVFGELDGSVLTCTLHGWRFDLDSGTCLTASDRRIAARRL
jgi:UDP-MurNAc hydroxylase